MKVLRWLLANEWAAAKTSLEHAVLDIYGLVENTHNLMTWSTATMDPELTVCTCCICWQGMCHNITSCRSLCIHSAAQRVALILVILLTLG